MSPRRETSHTWIAARFQLLPLEGKGGRGFAVEGELARLARPRAAQRCEPGIPAARSVSLRQPLAA